MKELLFCLSETFGLPGYEKPIRDLVQAELAGVSGQMQVDALGNLIVWRGERTPRGKRIMLAARLDEAGVMVSHIDKNGYARLNLLGKMPVDKLPGRVVKFANGAAGIIESDNPRDGKALEISSLFVDLGASGSADCPVKMGETAAFTGSRLENGKFIGGPGLAGRAGLGVLIETLRRLQDTPHEVCFVFSCLGSVGGRGAGTAAYTLEPDLAISIEAVPAADRPSLKEEIPAAGSGPVIQYGAGRLVFPLAPAGWLKAAANEAGLPFQTAAQNTDGGLGESIQSAGAGTPIGSLNIPGRHLHSALEIVHLDDVENAVRILLAALQTEVKPV